MADIENEIARAPVVQRMDATIKNGVAYINRIQTNVINEFNAILAIMVADTENFSVADQAAVTARKDQLKQALINKANSIT